jgi:hypothetical protein
MSVIVSFFAIYKATYDSREHAHKALSLSIDWSRQDCSPVDQIKGLVVIGFNSFENNLELGVRQDWRQSGRNESFNYCFKW